MKVWLHRHRRVVLLLYVALFTTATFVLQLLESSGAIR